MKAITVLRQLSEAAGVSGYEGEVATLVAEQFGMFTEEVCTDRMGNVIALKRGEGQSDRPRVMLAGHMDEIGLIVTQLEEEFLRFTNVGGIDPRVLLGQEVIVHGRRALPGIIGARPPT